MRGLNMLWPRSWGSMCVNDSRSPPPHAPLPQATIPTTIGFQSTTGFDLPSSASAPAPGAAPHRSSFTSPALNLRVHVDPTSFGTVIPSIKAPPPIVPDDTSSSSVGWKGLLEMSRNSGASGVVGVQRSVSLSDFTWPMPCRHVTMPHTPSSRSLAVA